jgi:hypothetical protein
MTPLDEKQVVQTIDDAIARYRGNTNELKGAIGAFMIARRLGWKPLMLMQDKRSVEKYERILGVSFREVCPDVGDLAHKSIAWHAMQKVKNFWKAVKGEIAGVRSPEVQ